MAKGLLIAQAVVTAVLMLYVGSYAESPVDRRFRAVEKWLQPNNLPPQNEQRPSENALPSSPQPSNQYERYPAQAPPQDQYGQQRERVDTFRPPQQRPSDGTFPASLEGKWKTSEGDLFFTQSGRGVVGRFSQDNNEISGTLSGNIFEGYWIEDGSAEQCRSRMNGRYYWGKIRFEIRGNSFTGKWGYCDKEPSTPLSGTRM